MKFLIAVDPEAAASVLQAVGAKIASHQQLYMRLYANVWLVNARSVPYGVDDWTKTLRDEVPSGVSVFVAALSDWTSTQPEWVKMVMKDKYGF